MVCGSPSKEGGRPSWSAVHGPSAPRTTSPKGPERGPITDATADQGTAASRLHARLGRRLLECRGRRTAAAPWGGRGADHRAGRRDGAAAVRRRGLDRGGPAVRPAQGHARRRAAEGEAGADARLRARLRRAPLPRALQPGRRPAEPARGLGARRLGGRRAAERPLDRALPDDARAGRVRDRRGGLRRQARLDGDRARGLPGRADRGHRAPGLPRRQARGRRAAGRPAALRPLRLQPGHQHLGALVHAAQDRPRLPRRLLPDRRTSARWRSCSRWPTGRTSR